MPGAIIARPTPAPADRSRPTICSSRASWCASIAGCPTHRTRRRPRLTPCSGGRADERQRPRRSCLGDHVSAPAGVYPTGRPHDCSPALPHISPPQSGVSVDGALVTPDTAPLHRCSRCGEAKPLGAFRRDSRGYVRSHCIACCLIDSQEWRARHHEALLARRRAAYPTPRWGTPHAATSPLRTAPPLSARTAEFRRVGGPTATSLGPS
jgi:hypothetical protein